MYDRQQTEKSYCRSIVVFTARTDQYATDCVEEKKKLTMLKNIGVICVRKTKVYQFLCILHSEMPTLGDLKSGEFSFKTPWYRTTTPLPPIKRRWDLVPFKSTSMPPNRLRACNVHHNLTAREKEQDFRSLPKTPYKVDPKLNWSLPKVFRCWPRALGRFL